VGIKRVPYSLLLPIIELTIWALLIPGEFALTYHRPRPPGMSSERWLALVKLLPLKYSRPIVAVNLPGIVPDALISLAGNERSTVHPAGISWENWRSLVFPFFCLPAWWFAGYGLDALRARTRPHRAALWTGSILCVLFLAPLFGYVTAPSGDRADLGWLVPGFCLWTILFGVFPLNWMLHRRNRKSHFRTPGASTGVS
jgi:hypothetical protein